MVILNLNYMFCILMNLCYNMKIFLIEWGYLLILRVFDFNSI